MISAFFKDGSRSLGLFLKRKNYFILRSEFNAYLKQIKVILYECDIFSLVFNTIYIFSL